jgi:hypothetical protein
MEKLMSYMAPNMDNQAAKAMPSKSGFLRVVMRQHAFCGASSQP